MAKKMEKTNVMRLLDQKKVPYESYCYVDAATMIRVLLLAKSAKSAALAA